MVPVPQQMSRTVEVWVAPVHSCINLYITSAAAVFTTKKRCSGELTTQYMKIMSEAQYIRCVGRSQQEHSVNLQNEYKP